MAKANPTKRDARRKPRTSFTAICVTTAQPITADPFWRSTYVSLRKKGKREQNPNVIMSEV